MNRRQLIRMTREEEEAFLDGEKTVVLCTIDPHGYPHAVAMWFCVIDGVVHMTTFRKSQKVVNLRRSPKATILAESGTAYSELRGLMIRGRGEIVDDLDFCADVLSKIHVRHGGETDPSLRDALRAQASKRVVLRLRPERTSSWDHSKLGGAY